MNRAPPCTPAGSKSLSLRSDGTEAARRPEQGQGAGGPEAGSPEDAP